MSAKTVFSTDPSIVQGDACLIGRFQAMGCPCEILLDTTDRSLAAEQLQSAAQEAQRIEGKYSRYLPGNIIDRINSGGKVAVDEETAALLDYAAECYDLSKGLFDVTTGVLRKIWRFDGSDFDVTPADRKPGSSGVDVKAAGSRLTQCRDDDLLDSAELAGVRSRMGWNKISWRRPVIELPSGFEIDLGGICKEYAADQILARLTKRHGVDTLVNLGGDIAAWGKRLWSVGIEDPARPSEISRTVHLRQGALATSGVTKRFTRKDGEVLGHILNPLTGWPVKNAPRSVTVAAKTCTEAGFWSTLAVLQGEKAEAFLQEQSLESWCYR